MKMYASVYLYVVIKGTLDKYNITPQIVPKNVEIFKPLDLLALVMTAC